MESKYTRCTEKTVQEIANGLSNLNIKSASQLAKELGLNVSGLIEHIKKYRWLVDTAECNKCGKKIGCERYNNFSYIVHDGEKAHSVIVSGTGSRETLVPSWMTKGVADESNPMVAINRMHRCKRYPETEPRGV